MENATRAMLMGAGVLLGVMLLSLLIYVFRTGGRLAQDYDITQNQNRLQYFNSKLFEYDKVIRVDKDSSGNLLTSTNYSTSKNVFTSRGNTINEVVSAINLAYDYNKNFSHFDGSYDDINKCLVILCDMSGNVVFTLPNNYTEQYKVKRELSVEGLSVSNVSVSDLLRLKMDGNSYSMKDGENLTDMHILANGESFYRFYFETSIHINEHTERIDRMAFIPVKMDDSSHTVNISSSYASEYGLTSSYSVYTLQYHD